jgi:hypothetical protein
MLFFWHPALRHHIHSTITISTCIAVSSTDGVCRRIPEVDLFVKCVLVQVRSWILPSCAPKVQILDVHSNKENRRQLLLYLPRTTCTRRIPPVKESCRAARSLPADIALARDIQFTDTTAAHQIPPDMEVLRQLDESRFVLNDIKHSRVEYDPPRKESLARIAIHLGHPEVHVMVAHGSTTYMVKKVNTTPRSSIDSSDLSGQMQPFS